MYGYIYKITNKINGKLYIGQTTRTVATRFNEHLYRAEYYCNKYGDKKYKYMHLYLAITKHGAENFIVETIDCADSKKELNKKERYWINFYDSIKTGYNMMPGGTDKNPMDSDIVKAKHDAIMRSDEVRNKISVSLKNYKQKYGISDTHRKRLSEAQHNRRCFIKDGKITYASLDDEQKVEKLLAEGWRFFTENPKPQRRQSPKTNDVGLNWAESPLILIRGHEITRTHSENRQRIDELLADGWQVYDSKAMKATEANPFATRSLSCYCILDTGERFDFRSIWDAGKWWYTNYRPFGDVYSTATYQRKIEASIAGKEIVFGNKTHKCYKKITNIKWYADASPQI
jgi:group I intron endonuclease